MRCDENWKRKIITLRRNLLKIIACIKQVPDSEAKVKAENGKVSWGDAPLVINPFDEYAVEGALQQKEAYGGTVTALCIGPESAKEALKHALAMGADDAILISDPALENIDTQGAARVLAAAVNKIGGVDMVVFGRQTLDNGAGLTPAQTARVLGWPMLGLAGSDQGPGWNGQRGPGHRGGQAKRQCKIARGAERRPKHWRAALPIVHGNPQSLEGNDPRLVVERRLAASAPEAIVKRTELMNPPVQETTIEIITGESSCRDRR